MKYEFVEKSDYFTVNTQIQLSFEELLFEQMPKFFSSRILIPHVSYNLASIDVKNPKMINVNSLESLVKNYDRPALNLIEQLQHNNFQLNKAIQRKIAIHEPIK